MAIIMLINAYIAPSIEPISALTSSLSGPADVEGSDEAAVLVY
jgi:hypothetical protein